MCIVVHLLFCWLRMFDPGFNIHIKYTYFVLFFFTFLALAPDLCTTVLKYDRSASTAQG